ncbi:MAG TPA: hypothetical protein VIW92_07175 [Thermoanaerobaculia bacterium]
MNSHENDELRERIEESGLLAHDVLRHDLDLDEEVVFPLYLYDSAESRDEVGP